MKTCLIYGQNGLDLDVAFNLKAFYKKLGYWTVFSDKLFSSDILVILRAVDKAINVDLFGFKQVHVYDYGGWLYDGCIKSLDFEKTYVFTTSPKHKNHLINSLNFPKESVHIAFPPVEVSLWVESISSKRYNFVHVGNFKKIDSKDFIRERFNQAIEILDADVWGLDWNFRKGDKYHGKAGLFSVSKIYAKAKFGLGLMYPFQREVTFSGRFWHAPINGCFLFSEKSLYSSEIPGILETDYSPQSISNTIENLTPSSNLQKAAIEYWETKNRSLANLIIEKLPHLPSGNLPITPFIINSVKNILKAFYQKYNLFKFFSKSI